MFTRICPKCKEEIFHSSKYNARQAEKQGKDCRACSIAKRVGNFSGDKNPFYGKTHSEESKQKISKKFKGQRHSPKTEFKKGQSTLNKRPCYEIWVEKYGVDRANDLNRKLSLKKSQNSSGSNNPMFGKPTPQGSGNGWSGWYLPNNYFFRSLRELSYIIKELEPNQANWCSAERQNLTINYISPLGIKRTYRADFIVNNVNLIEIKPKRLWSTPQVVAKKEAAELFCNQNNLIYSLVDSELLSPGELINLLNNNKIKFTKKYEEKFKKWIQKDQYY